MWGSSLPAVAGAFAFGVLLVAGACPETFSMALLPLGFELSARNRCVGLSGNGVFAFGFHGDDDNGLVVAIWYNLGGGAAANVPIWAAGGGIRVSVAATLLLSGDGNLVIFDHSPKAASSLVWSSNTARMGVRSISLRDDGNLVLSSAGNGSPLWESYRHPTHALLPGQALRFPQSLRPLSVGAVSPYSLAFTSSGGVSLLWKDNVTYWTSEGNYTTDVVARLDISGLFGLFGGGSGAAWFRLSNDFEDSAVELRYLRIDLDGNLRIYSWLKDSSSWKIGWQAVQDQCDVFGFCGVYGLCGYNSSGPECTSLASPPQRSGGCGGAPVAMRTLKNTVLYSLYPPHDMEVRLSSEACRNICQEEESCVAATVMTDGSGLCNIKRSTFIAGYGYSTVAAISFLKTCDVPEAADVVSSSSEVASRHPQDPTAVIAVIILATAGVFFSVELLLLLLLLLRRRREKRGTQRAEQVEMVHGDLMRLSIEQVEIATKGFRMKLEQTAFKGFLPGGAAITVKIVTDALESEKEFLAGVSELSRAGNHRNLIVIKGFCFDPEKKMLVYEYVSGETLDRWLVRRRYDRCDGGWQRIMSVAGAVARALRHLHLGGTATIVHGNLTAANVIIGGDNVPKLANYGLQKLQRRSGQAETSSESLPERDVFMLGAILLQLVSGGGEAEEMYRLGFKACREGEIESFMNGRLVEGGGGAERREEVERVVRLGLWCMQERPQLRPSASEVVAVLESSLDVDLPPSM